MKIYLSAWFNEPLHPTQVPSSTTHNKFGASKQNHIHPGTSQCCSSVCVIKTYNNNPIKHQPTIDRHRS
eukprot:m.372950 g.372950  ORF g.372950 m.372950 type:complete len:69 (+) comp20881_c0_seq4:838-1044(+)